MTAPRSSLRSARSGAVLALALSCVLLSFADAAIAAPILLQTIDLSTAAVTPVQIVVPPPPQPAPGFSLTGIAFDPTSRILYVSDYATTNVYAIDGIARFVQSAVYTNGLFSAADIGVTQNIAGTGPKSVLVNPATGRWSFMGQAGGAQFSSTTFDEGVDARAMQWGGAWDPVTDTIYGADGVQFFAVNNLKFLFAGNPCTGGSNAVTVNPLTSRVYVSCGNSQTGGGIVAYDGAAVAAGSANNAPASALARAFLGAQPTGLAVNPATNRLYVAGMTSATSVDVLDASTLALIASIPGLPDQSARSLVAGFNLLPLPRPMAIDTLGNTIFVVNSVSSTVSVIDGASNALIGTIAVPVAGAVITQPVSDFGQLSEIKPGNTIYDASSASLTTLAGVIGASVDETGQTLYLAGVNGTVGVYMLDSPAAAATFSVNGIIRTGQGAPVANVSVTASGPGVAAATAVTDANGLFVITGLPSGSYTVKPASPTSSFAPASQGVAVAGANGRGLDFTAGPLVALTALSTPLTAIGPGVTTTATVSLDEPAPAGGAQLVLTASDPKAAKIPASVTVPAGQRTVSFQVQGNGVSAPKIVTVGATHNGSTAATSITVAPGDKVSILSVTFSKSTRMLTVTASGSNPQLAVLAVTLASNNQALGTMRNLGGSNFVLQQPFLSGTPSSINVSSNLGAKTGQGVQVIP